MSGKYNFIKPNRPVSKVFIHCSASGRPEHDDVSVIKEWHLERGWSDVGYHLFIRYDGLVQKGRTLEKIPAAQYGHNSGTIAICLHGLNVGDFTYAQFNSLQNVTLQIDSAYDDENITFHGHCEVSDKACPVFDYKAIMSLDKNGYLTQKSRVGSSYIKVFDRGMDVIQLQGALNEFYVNLGIAVHQSIADLFPLVDDGMFGASTERAVRMFQRLRGLEDDGIVGPETKLALSDRPGKI